MKTPTFPNHRALRALGLSLVRRGLCYRSHRTRRSRRHPRPARAGQPPAAATPATEPATATPGPAVPVAPADRGGRGGSPGATAAAPDHRGSTTAPSGDTPGCGDTRGSGDTRSSGGTSHSQRGLASRPEYPGRSGGQRRRFDRSKGARVGPHPVSASPETSAECRAHGRRRRTRRRPTEHGA